MAETGLVSPTSSKTSLGYMLGLLDASALIDVLEIYASVHEILRLEGHADYAPQKRYTGDDFSRLLNSGRMIGAMANGKAVGFVFMGETSMDKPQDGVPGMHPFYDPSCTAVMRNAMVHPKYQGFGLGRKLFEACVGLAKNRGYAHIVSGVTAPNVWSWHNLVHAGLQLVQVDSLPPEISPNSNTLAFYFHKRFCDDGIPTDGVRNATKVDPLANPDLVRALLQKGCVQVGYERSNGLMLLHFSGERS